MTMLSSLLGRSAGDAAATLAAIAKSQAIIEFTPDGTILDANQNFLGVMGYTLEEVRGQHQRILVERSYAQSPEYAEFWRRLGRGEFDSAEYKRLSKGGREVWIQASYNPIYEHSGTP